MSTNKNNICNFNEVIERLCQLSRRTKDIEIAELLGFKKDTYAARKSRGSIPDKEIRLTCAMNGWSANWVINGVGEPILNSNGNGPSNTVKDYLDITEALEGNPVSQIFMKDIMQLNEADMAQAYADFVKNWKGKK